MAKARCVAALALALVQLGCAMRGPAPSAPAPLRVPDGYVHAAPAAPTATPNADATWWHAGELPVLDAWVGAALSHNTDLALAGVRLRRAMLDARLAGEPLLPSVSGDWQSRISRALGAGPQVSTTVGTGRLGASWELDLFGRLGAQQDAAQREAEATAQDQHAVQLMLVAGTAELYFQLAHANARVALAEAGERDARRIAGLVQARVDAGVDGPLALHEAAQGIHERTAELAELRQMIAVLRERLRVLLGGAAPAGPEPQALPGDSLPAVQAGLPAELLGRRPDLRAAQWRLAAARSRADAAAASLYPRLSLTGALGTSSRALLDVLANPVASLGAGVALPVLQARTLHIETAIARTRVDEAQLAFRKTLLTAMGEVEQALSARLRLAEQERALRDALHQADEVARVYEVRYRTGLGTLRDWLDARQRQRAARLAHAATRLAQWQQHIQLCQVLGGPWLAPGQATTAPA